ncbi:hypothetical protein C9374_007216 [Naegleria lovaniensis]|uniref:Homeobox domain-containing protein n=1 Tax=Naegleria lovaniensis TaxID=51637 RepID=A0AA88KY38_NAELO|nr:uncharacterized protein C9374_007216 [Naegleria lovaniensis]KAG2393685.1 hypothetical protein C9374_007216 [Naegleria lovaniensis]
MLSTSPTTTTTTLEQPSNIFSEHRDLCGDDENLMGDFDSSPLLSSSHHHQLESDSESVHDEKSSSKNGKKRKGYSKEITKVLNDWFFANLQNPYPSEEEKKEMVNQTTLSLLQINNWFSNKRVRYKRKMQKEGQEVIDGGVVIDINQAFRSIKKQNKGEKKESVSDCENTCSTAPPKRKRSTASKDSSCQAKKKRPTPLSNVFNHGKMVSVTSETLTPTPSSEPKNVLSSLLESPSNKNLNGSSVRVLLRSPILTSQTTTQTTQNHLCSSLSPQPNSSYTSPTMSVQHSPKMMTPDERSPCSSNTLDSESTSQQPKKIDFFQSLQQAGVIFPQTPVIPVIPSSYPQYAFVHHHHAAAAYYPVNGGDVHATSTPSPTSSPYQYSYPIYTTTPAAIPTTFYHHASHTPSTSTFMIPKEEEGLEIGCDASDVERNDATSCFELEDNCLEDSTVLTSNCNHENYSCQDNTFNTTDLFESTAENEECLFLDGGRDMSSASWMNSAEDCSLLYF